MPFTAASTCFAGAAASRSTDGIVCLCRAGNGVGGPRSGERLGHPASLVAALVRINGGLVHASSHLTIDVALDLGRDPVRIDRHSLSLTGAVENPARFA